MKTEQIKTDITKGFMLINLSIATSIDALAVGFIIGIDNADIVLPSIIIGVVCALITLLGIFLGERLSKFFGKKIGILGGIILISIGLKILIEHLMN
jgi:putative Mn2+ efflux pump MntP